MARIRTIKPAIWGETDEAPGDGVCWLYCIVEEGDEETGPCKVGIATHLAKRLSSLQGGNRRHLNLIWQVRISKRQDARDTEEHCLITYRPSIYSVTDQPRLASEWVDASPAMVLATAMQRLNVEAETFRRIA